MAASKVNVKFVVLLSAMLGMVFVGVAGAFVYIKLRSGDRYVQLGDARLAAGDIPAADKFYSRAVGKDQSKVDWLIKWRDTRRKKIPETQTMFADDYTMYVSILRTLANAKRTDIEAHREYLDELLAQATSVGPNLDVWRRLMNETDASLKFFSPERPGALRRYRGIATVTLATISEQVPASDVNTGREDLEAALIANPADEMAANDLAVLYREAARKAVAAENRDEATADIARAEKVLNDLIAAAPESVFAFAAKLSLEAADVELMLDKTKSKQDIRAAREQAIAALTPRIKELGERLEKADPARLTLETLTRYAQLAGALDPKAGAMSTVRAIDRALTAAKDDMDLMLLRSQMLSTAGDLEGAITQYQGIIDQPRKPVSLSGLRQFDAKRQAMFLQTNSAMALAVRAKDDERPAALARVNKYREQLARNVAEHAPELLLIDARVKYLEGDLRGSQRLLADFVKAPGGMTSQVPEARLLTADIASKLGQTGLAIDELEQVIAVRPGSVDMLLNLAAMYSQMQQTAKAMATYAQVLDLDPQNETAAKNLQLLRAIVDTKGPKLDDKVMQLLVDAERLQRGTAEKLGDEQAALDLLEKNIAPNGGDPRIVIPVVRMRIARNDIEGARAALKAGLAGHPDDADMKNYLARLDSAGTIEGVLGLIDAQPGDPVEKWWSKHQAYTAFGKKPEAKAALAEMSKLRPEDPRAIEAGFLIALADNDLVEAQRLTDLAVKSDADRSEGDTYRARLLLAKGELKEAAGLLERAAQRGNATAPLLRLWGLVQLQMGRDQGISAIKQALELNPTDLTTIKTYLSALVQLNRQADALALARESQSVAQLDPEFLSAWLSLESLAGNRAFAVERREQIQKRSPGNLSNGVALAELYCETRQWDQARALMDKLRVGNETDIRIAVADARWHADKGDIDGALKVFVTLIGDISSKLPSDKKMPPDAYATFGRFMMQRGRMDLGIAAMKQAEQLQDPTKMDVSLSLGESLLTNGMYGDAEQVFRKVLDAKVPDPRHQIVKRLIECYIQQRKLAEAEKEFVALGTGADDDVELMAQRAHAARGLGDTKRARDILDRAVAKFPGEPLPYVRRARLLMLSPDTLKDAIADLDTSIKISPGMWQARRTRGTLLLNQGRIDEGLKDLTAAVEANPGYDTLRLDLIDTLLQNGKEPEAMDIADAGLKPRPNDARLIGSIGDRFAAQGRWARAQRFYKMLWQQLGDEPSAIVYVNSLLSGTPPAVAEADAVLATPSLNTSPSGNLLLARALVRKKQGKDDAAKADAVAAFDRSIGNTAQLADWATRMRKPFPEPRAALAVLAAVKAPAGLADWMSLQKGAVMLEDAATRSEGISILEGLIANCPDRDTRLDACRILPQGYRTDNKFAEALAATKKGLEIRPDDWMLNNNAACFLSDNLGKAPEALPYAERAAKAQPQNDSVLDTLASVQWRLGAKDKAIEIETEALRRARSEADKARWALTLAGWKLEMKDKAGATGLLDTLREMLSDSVALVPEFRSKVDQLEKDIQGAP